MSKRDTEKQVQNIKRFISHRAFYSRLMTFWAFGTLLVFGFYGLRRLYILSREKSALITEMKEVNSQLRKNRTKLAVIKFDLNKAYADLRYLDEYMPESYDPQKYLLDLSYAASKSNFSITRYSPYDNKAEEGLGINALFEGFGNMAELVKNVEELKRITSVENIRYTYYEGEFKVRMSVRIFNGGEPIKR